MVRSDAEVERIVRKTLQLAAERLPLAAAYLFGSYCDGTADEDSDIDIALFSPAAKDLSLNDRITLLTDIRLAVGAEVELHLFDQDCLAEARPSNFYGHIVSTGRKVG